MGQVGRRIRDTTGCDASHTSGNRPGRRSVDTSGLFEDANEVTMAVQVEIWTDINCPFCYLGKRRFEQALAGFEHRDQVRVVHRSFELDPTLPAGHSGPVVAHIAEKYGISEAQAAANERGIAAQAQAVGLPYRTEGRDFGNSFDMHRLLHFALDRGRQDAVL